MRRVERLNTDLYLCDVPQNSRSEIFSTLFKAFKAIVNVWDAFLQLCEATLHQSLPFLVLNSSFAPLIGQHFTNVVRTLSVSGLQGLNSRFNRVTNTIETFFKMIDLIALVGRRDDHKELIFVVVRSLNLAYVIGKEWNLHLTFVLVFVVIDDLKRLSHDCD